MIDETSQGDNLGIFLVFYEFNRRMNYRRQGKKGKEREF